MISRRSLIILPCLAAALHAQIVPVTHTFDDPATFPAGAWTGTGGWSTTQSGGTFHVSSGSSNGTNYIAFYDVGGGVGATASRTMSAPATNEQFALTFDYSTGNLWGTQVGLGPSALNGLTLTAAQYEGPRAYLTLGGVSLSSGALALSDQWHSVRVEVNLGANGGSGSATVFAKPASSGTWSPISGMTNISLGLDATRTALDATNPLNWNTLAFHHEGATSGIDNIAMSAIPEPSTYAAIAGGAMLGLAVWRRRRPATAG